MNVARLVECEHCGVSLPAASIASHLQSHRGRRLQLFQPTLLPQAREPVPELRMKSLQPTRRYQSNQRSIQNHSPWQRYLPALPPQGGAVQAGFALQGVQRLQSHYRSLPRIPDAASSPQYFSGLAQGSALLPSVGVNHKFTTAQPSTQPPQHQVYHQHFSVPQTQHQPTAQLVTKLHLHPITEFRQPQPQFYHQPQTIPQFRQPQPNYQSQSFFKPISYNLQLGGQLKYSFSRQLNPAYRATSNGLSQIANHANGLYVKQDTANDDRSPIITANYRSPIADHQVAQPQSSNTYGHINAITHEAEWPKWIAAPTSLPVPTPYEQRGSRPRLNNFDVVVQSRLEAERIELQRLAQTPEMKPRRKRKSLFGNVQTERNVYNFMLEELKKPQLRVPPQQPRPKLQLPPPAIEVSKIQPAPKKESRLISQSKYSVWEDNLNPGQKDQSQYFVSLPLSHLMKQLDHQPDQCEACNHRADTQCTCPHCQRCGGCASGQLCYQVFEEDGERILLTKKQFLSYVREEASQLFKSLRGCSADQPTLEGIARRAVQQVQLDPSNDLTAVLLRLCGQAK